MRRRARAVRAADIFTVPAFFATLSPVSDDPRWPASRMKCAQSELHDNICIVKKPCDVSRWRESLFIETRNANGRRLKATQSLVPLEDVATRATRKIRKIFSGRAAGRRSTRRPRPGPQRDVGGAADETHRASGGAHLLARAPATRLKTFSKVIEDTTK